MSRPKLFSLILLAMLAFAGNSLLCRAALLYTAIDPASFTTLRLLSGALTLWLIVRLRHVKEEGEGNWLSGLMLFVYAGAFSFAYVSLPAAVGALLLFGSVQVTMIAAGLWKGERMRPLQIGGFVMAFAGLMTLLLPGLASPSLRGSFFMIAAGAAWGMYSLRGRGKGNPTRVTAGNFLRALPFALGASLLLHSAYSMDNAGLIYALISGALTSGIGYAVWYTVLPALKATEAATIQMSVPIIAAVVGVILLGEVISIRLVFASIAVLGGIALVVLHEGRATTKN
jgi:drug/metabolite transporter (DMT)-like permease